MNTKCDAQSVDHRLTGIVGIRPTAMVGLHCHLGWL